MFKLFQFIHVHKVIGLIEPIIKITPFNPRTLPHLIPHKRPRRTANLESGPEGLGVNNLVFSLKMRTSFTFGLPATSLTFLKRASIQIL